MSKPTSELTLEAFVEALTPDEHAAWERIIAALADPSTERAAVTGAWFALANPVVARLGRGNAGWLYGAARRAHAPARRDASRVPLTELARSLPYPLGFKLDGLLRAQQRREEGEPEAQFPFELCALMGLLVRVSALVGVQAYVATGGKDAGVNHRIAEAIQRPSDGKWLELAHGLVKDLKGRELAWLDRVGAALDGKPAVDPAVKKAAGASKKVMGHLSDLVSFRNKLLHGEPLDDADLDRAWAQLCIVVRGFSWLADYHLAVRHADTCWILNGAVPQPGADIPDLADAEPTLVGKTDADDRLSLSPLLRFRPGEGEADVDVDFDELFFLNAGTLERLSYIGYRAGRHLDGRTLGSYEAFKAFLAQIPTPPIPKDPRIDFGDLAAQHSQLFVGRSELLAELTDRVASAEDQYVLVKALAGMGKTAVMASLLQADRNRQADAVDTASAADGLLRDGDRWVFHFCQPTDGRNSPTVALRSLIAQVCDHFGFDREPWLSQDLDKLKDELFPPLLAKASDALEGDARLVVVIDALDEGIGADKESVPSCIPGGTYDGVVFLLSYRVDDEGQNSRVEKQLRHLAPERLATATHADPLQGLQRDDVARFLGKLQAAYATPAPHADTESATWTAATQDAVEGRSAGADPFYLRFVADGVQQHTIRLDRAETIPTSLDDAFEEQWMGLPTDKDFLCHRVLLTLAILREYGEDALFSELFNRDLPDDQQLTPEDVALVRRKAGKLLVYDGDRYGLFHDRFKRFLVGEQKDPIAEALEAG